ncbi:MAG: V-type ATP synthase subunit A [Thermoprotei archaeon]|nr:MAG: V-type ATP synthase subunit A [Thermoprotei archaeon]RLF23363.1 MAG: V-type ATP synthase subunit A [Thermoprotei archaeon]
MRVGVIERIKGPVVIASGIKDVQIGEVIEVGEERLIGEVVRVTSDNFTIQVYESTSGLRPGEKVYATGKRLVAELGPGLMSRIFDGIQRPLEEILRRTGPFIRRGVKLNALPRDKKWYFKPLVKKGDVVEGGSIIGIVPETRIIEHRVLVPPDIKGEIVKIEEGEFKVDETVAIVRDKRGREHEIKLMQEWPVRVPRPFKSRLPLTEPLITGQRVIDTFFPVAKGGAACIPGGFGTGKTVTLHKIAMWSDSEIVVYIGCGERGNEMCELLTEFPKLIDPRKKVPMIERSIMIANTSNMPVSAREASIYMGITIAEYYRDQGYHVTLIADSTSRWAEAVREISGRLEEMPVEEGFPAYLPDRLAEFYERAGRVVALGTPEREGSVTILAAVSPPGGDFNEPVTIHTLRFVGAMWALDTDLAYRRHFPAINWLRSFSQYAEPLEKWWVEKFPEFPNYRRRALRLLTVASEIEAIASVIGEGALPDDQRLILLTAEIIKEGFLRQVAMEGEDTFCKPEKQYLMLKMIMDFYDRAYILVRHRVPVDDIANLPEVFEMMRVKEDERGVEAVKEVYEKVIKALDNIARKYGIDLEGELRGWRKGE